MPTLHRVLTRVAVVQMDYHPAALFARRNPLEDPIFQFDQLDSLLPEDGSLSDSIEPRLRDLRQRIRQTYAEQLLGRLRAVLRACRAWQVQLVVLPEYSVPYDILAGVADETGPMVVVAGTHAVDRTARESGIYQRLGWPTPPETGQAVCPVLYDGRLLALQTKLNPSQAERGMKAGKSWSPILMPPPIAGPLGLLVCLDFLYRESDSHQRLVAPHLNDCRFLAVPSLTPYYTLPEFAGKAWEEARRYGRPVLYADIAGGTASKLGGGTSIYVDEGRETDLRRFPDHAGYLEPGDEGLIVADVDLGYERTGRSTRYDAARPIVPVAAASLVYRKNLLADRYAEFLSGLEPLLADDALDDCVAQLETNRELVLNAAALPGGRTRQRRLRQLLTDLPNITDIEDIRRFTHEVAVPPGVLPMEDLRAALARGAADAIRGWTIQFRALGMDDVLRRLESAAEPARTPDSAMWHPDGLKALAEVADRLQEPPTELSPTRAEPTVRVMLPEGIQPATLGKVTAGGFQFLFVGHPEQIMFAVDEAAAPERRDILLRRTAMRPPEPDMVTLEAELSTFFELAFLRSAAGKLQLLAEAEDGIHLATFTAVSLDQKSGGAFVLFQQDEKWTAWLSEDLQKDLDLQRVTSALSELGFQDVQIEVIEAPDELQRTRQLQDRFRGARDTVTHDLAERLREVDGQFEEPDVTVPPAVERKPAIAELDDWFASGVQTLLVLGEFGCGKSTLLAYWADALWQRHEQLGDAMPIPIFCNLAGAGATADAMRLLLDAAGVEDTAANRAALELLIREQRILPIFDGFDEMATRVTPAELAGRLAALLSVTGKRGRVIISCRDHYFPDKDNLQTAWQRALHDALGQSSNTRRLMVQLFNEEQVRRLVTRVRGDQLAPDVLRRIVHQYPLEELARRPLLLAMVLQTIDRTDPDAAISRADLYQAYLDRWLDQTHRGEQEVFSDAQKTRLAEAVAEALWRTGRPACAPQELEELVRRELLAELPGDIPPDAALLETFGGSFFVHEGEHAFRFAHKSFLEFFLARRLVEHLPERPSEVLSTRPITREVAAFVGELLRRDGRPQAQPAVRSLQAWLRDGRRAEGKPEGTAVAAANAARLLAGLGAWSGDHEGWFPEGADLQQVDLHGEALGGVVWKDADLRRANLARVKLDGAVLDGSVLEQSTWFASRLNGVALRHVRAPLADFALAAVRDCRLEGTLLGGSRLRQSQWFGCDWTGADLSEADLTVCLAPELPTRQMDQQLRPLPPQIRAAMALRHMGDVRCVSWSPDGRQLASGGADGTVRVWNPGDAERALCCTWNIAGSVWWVETPGGSLLLGEQARSTLCLSIGRPEQPATLLYAPLGVLAEVLHRPDRVAEALAGDLSHDDPSSALAQAGWTGQGIWDGHAWFAPASPRIESQGETGEPTLEPNRFLPGRAVSGIDHLAGRDKLLDDLLALIANRSPAVLRGPRRSGKTSILNAPRR